MKRPIRHAAALLATALLATAPLVTALLVTALLVAALLAGVAAATDPSPTRILAIGDSVTLGACLDATCTPRPSTAWATGSDPRVRSVRRPFDAYYQGFAPSVSTVRDMSSSDAKMAGLVAAIKSDAGAGARADGGRLVVIALGANDVCAGTPPSQFRRELNAGLDLLGAGMDRPMVLSIADPGAVWTALHATPAVAVWLGSGHTLTCGLGRSVTSRRLAQLHARTLRLNQILAETCFAHAWCLYDGGAHYRMPIEVADFSRYDYRRLSVAGEQALGTIEWPIAQRLLLFTSG